MKTIRLNLLEETRFEKIPVSIYKDESTASNVVAKKIAKLISDNNAVNQKTVLGLATGATPIKVYKELIRLHKEEGLSFKNVITFNLDEYYPMKSHASQSYVAFMNDNLFNHIDIDRNNIHIPEGELAEGEIFDFCADYEKKLLLMVV